MKKLARHPSREIRASPYNRARARDVAAFAPILALTVHTMLQVVCGHYPRVEQEWGITQLSMPEKLKPITMSPRAPILLTLACLFQLLQTAPVHSASIPPSLSLAITNATFNGNPAYCNNYEGWVGAGIARGDCTEAIAEFYRTNVEPRGGQRFEFLTRGVPRNTHLPYIVTPRKHDYGE